MKPLVLITLLAFIMNVYAVEHKQIEMQFHDRKIPKIGPMVRSLSKDSKGYYWFATRLGLVRFDGVESIYIYGAPGEALYNMDINRMLKVGDILWLGLHAGGVATLNLQSYLLTSYPNGEAHQNKLFGSIVTGIDYDKNGEIWISTTEGLNRFRPESGGFENYLLPEEDSEDSSYRGFKSVAVDDNNIVWLATMRQGLKLLDLETRTFESPGDLILPENKPMIIKELKSREIKNTYRDYDGSILVLHSNHLFKFDKGKNLTKKISFDSEVLGVMPDSLEIVGKGKKKLIRTSNVNLLIVSPDLEKVDYVVDSSPNVSGDTSVHQVAVHVEENGSIAIGHFLGYPKFWNSILDHVKTLKYKSSGKNSKIRDIVDYKGGYLLADGTKFIKFVDKEFNLIKTFSLPFAAYDIEIAWGYLWSGGDNGIKAYDLKNNKIVREFENYGRQLLYDSSSGLWMVGYDGIARLPLIDGKLERYLEGKSITTYTSNIELTEDGGAFITVSGLLFFYDKNLNMFYQVKYENGSVVKNFGKDIVIRNDIVYSLGEHLVKYKVISIKNRKRLRHLNVIDGYKFQKSVISLNSKYGIWSINDVGNILVYFNFNSGRVSKFQSAEGFPAGKGSSILWATKQGSLLIIKGERITRVDISKSYFTQKVPLEIHTVTISDLFQKQRYQYDFESLTRLNSKESSLTVSFGNFESNVENRPRVEYRLIGLHRNWLISDKHQVTFSSLAPGSYQFEVRDLVNKQDKKSISIVVEAPWWRSAWLKLVYLLIALIFIGLLVYLRWDRIRITRKSKEDLMLYAKGLEKIDQGVCFFNKTRQLVSNNKAFNRFLESDKPHKGKDILDCLTLVDTADIIPLWKELIETDHWHGKLNAIVRGVPIYLELRGSKIGPSDNEDLYMFITSDVTEHVNYENNLKQIATTDALTNLPNRFALEKEISNKIRSIEFKSNRFSVLFMDVDRFKNINDSLSHFVGDRILVGIAERLSACLNEGEYMARQGGDEFVVLTNMDVGRRGALEVANRLLKETEAAFIVDGKELFVSISIGVSIYSYDSMTLSKLLRNADIAMYSAKENGGNGVSIYDPKMNRRSLENLKLESSLRAAIENNEFHAYLQAKVNLVDGRLCGFETLVRWHSPTEGIIMPDLFIPAAETTGLIIKVGKIVLIETCKQLARWREMGLDLVPIAVNVSPQQLMKPNFATEIDEIIEQYSLDRRLIELEITEGMVMKDMDVCIQQLQYLRSKGHTIAVDDFGTGYSSLSYIKDLPIDVLKIDRSFMTELSSDRGQQSIVRTIMELAKNLELKTVAEGVETTDDHDFLEKLGCDTGQGYLYAKPLNPNDPQIVKMMSENFTFFKIKSDVVNQTRNVHNSENNES